MATRIIEWFVHATRGDTTVRLAAPEGEAQASSMASNLIEYDWHDVKVENIPHVAQREPDSAPSRVWPPCERCTRKHSPFDHDKSDCTHCLGTCQAGQVVWRQAEHRDPELAKATDNQAVGVRIDASPGLTPPNSFRHGMTFQEFLDWLKEGGVR